MSEAERVRFNKKRDLERMGPPYAPCWQCVWPSVCPFDECAVRAALHKETTK